MTKWMKDEMSKHSGQNLVKTARALLPPVNNNQQNMEHCEEAPGTWICTPVSIKPEIKPMKPSRTSGSGTKCYVPGCPSRHRLHPQVSFHRIPVNSKSKKKWLKAIQRDKEPTLDIGSNRFVCSEHFSVEDFCIGNRKYLKGSAVPTFKLPPSHKKGYLRVVPQSKLTGESGPEESVVGGASENLGENIINRDNHRAWMIALGRSPSERVAESRRVCSNHFSEKNFTIRDGKVALNDNALPDIVPKFAVPASSLTGNSSRIFDHQTVKLPGPDTLVVPIQIKMDIGEAPLNGFEGFSFEDPLLLSNVTRMEEPPSNDLDEDHSSMQKIDEYSEDTTETSSTYTDSSDECQDEDESQHQEIPGESSGDICEYGCESHHKKIPREFIEAIHSYAISPAKLADKLKMQEAVIGRMKEKLKTLTQQHNRLKLRVYGLERTFKDLGLKKRNIKKKKNVPKDVEKILDVTHNGVPIYLVKAQKSAEKKTTEDSHQEHNDVSTSGSDSS